MFSGSIFSGTASATDALHSELTHGKGPVLHVALNSGVLEPTTDQPLGIWKDFKATLNS